ncbi:MAG: hypothetical protein KAS74_02480 [Methanosarcinales archaeon]|nr:hypothetical protein [Methanosarcinales archaeon]
MQDPIIKKIPILKNKYVNFLLFFTAWLVVYGFDDVLIEFLSEGNLIEIITLCGVPLVFGGALKNKYESFAKWFFLSSALLVIGFFTMNAGDGKLIKLIAVSIFLNMGIIIFVYTLLILLIDFASKELSNLKLNSET